MTSIHAGGRQPLYANKKGYFSHSSEKVPAHKQNKLKDFNAIPIEDEISFSL